MREALPLINVIITDDHPLIREGLKNLIDKRMGMQVTAECSKSSEVLDAIKIVNCDVLVLDINLPDKSGLDLLKELKAIAPNLKILILSMHPEKLYAVRALRSGASGYMTKMAASKELINAIERIWKGGRYVSVELADHLAIELGSHESDIPHEKLSDREFQVLLLIGSGKAPQQMTDILSVSLSTVNTYRQRILLKMKMQANQELIRYCIKNNLVD
jgi:DNA-binding NarL/FixJ family response regulator